MNGFEWYLDFIDLSYEPSEDELICVFRVEASKGFSVEEAAGRIASESSVGTWTTLYKLPSRVKKLMAKAYRINGELIEIAYPIELFELGNIPQLLSSIAGNIYGMKAVKNLRLVDVKFPRKYVESFKGPIRGIAGLRRILRVMDRPLTATVPKPKVGYSAGEYAEVAREAWMGGVDLVKDDENLTSQSFNRFNERLKLVMRVRDEVEREVGERKSYLVNITAETLEMIKRAKLVADYGNEYIMIDFLTTGWASLQTIRDKCEELGLAIHAHRAMHAALTRNPKHGISMLVLAKLARLVGVDQIHVGSVIGKMAGEVEEVLEITSQLRSKWFHVKPVFPVSSGGLHPGLIPEILKMFGVDLVIQVGGGIHGHPDGTLSGARALRQAIESSIAGIPLEEYAEERKELRRALEKWGKVKPK